MVSRTQLLLLSLVPAGAAPPPVIAPYNGNGGPPASDSIADIKAAATLMMVPWQFDSVDTIDRKLTKQITMVPFTLDMCNMTYTCPAQNINQQMGQKLITGQVRWHNAGNINFDTHTWMTSFGTSPVNYGNINTPEYTWTADSGKYYSIFELDILGPHADEKSMGPMAMNTAVFNVQGGRFNGTQTSDMISIGKFGNMSTGASPINSDWWNPQVSGPSYVTILTVVIEQDHKLTEGMIDLDDFFWDKAGGRMRTGARFNGNRVFKKYNMTKPRAVNWALVRGSMSSRMFFGGAMPVPQIDPGCCLMIDTPICPCGSVAVQSGKTKPTCSQCSSRRLSGSSPTSDCTTAGEAPPPCPTTETSTSSDATPQSSSSNGTPESSSSDATPQSTALPVLLAALIHLLTWFG